MRFRSFLVLSILFSLLVLPGAVLAKSSNSFSLPDSAVQRAPHIYSLGVREDVDGSLVEGFAIINTARNFTDQQARGKKPPNAGGKSKNQCYAYLSKGAKWKELESYIVDSTNTQGLADSFVRGIVASDINTWEAAATAQILDNETFGVVDGVDTVSPDNKNEFMFGSIEEPGVIGVTIVWGIFSGPPRGRVLVEWDMILDQDDFAWSLTGEAGKMDFENIVNHELGHALGLGHPEDTCTEETMYRFVGLGETKKRSLEAGDIEGIFSLYK